VNLSATFVELAISLSTAWSIEGPRILQTARGGDAPYRIRNFTGIPLNIWSDVDAQSQLNHPTIVKLLEDEFTDWRFEDWRSMREVIHKATLNPIF
jgi:vacuolar protein sorting-associated protein 13A/C